MLLLVAQADDGKCEGGSEVQLSGHEWFRGALSPAMKTPQSSGEGLDEVAGEAEEITSLLGAEQEQAQVQHRSDAVKAELELGDHPEVAATAAKGPKQIGVVRL